MNRHGGIMKVIFLDIDGVLNSSKTVDRNFDYPELDPRNLAVLQEIVSKTAGAKAGCAWNRLYSSRFRHQAESW